MMESGHTNAVDIITPKEFHIVSSDARRTCEVFIARILSCSLPEISIEVDIENRFVSCSEQGIKQLLQLIIGAGGWTAFEQQLLEYLSKTEPDQNEGILSLMLQDRPHDYLVAMCQKPQGLVKIRIHGVPKP